MKNNDEAASWDGKSSKAANAARRKAALNGCGRLMRSFSGEFLGELAKKGLLFQSVVGKEIKRRASKRVGRLNSADVRRCPESHVGGWDMR